MNRKTISSILLIIILATTVLTLSSVFLNKDNTMKNQTGTLTIDNKTVQYENMGKCIDVIDGNTIDVYGIGRVQLTQVDIPKKEPELSNAKNFVIEKCLGKTVYLNIDDKKPKDNYDRTLAVVYVGGCDVNRELLDSNMAKVSYFTPSEFEKGEV